MINKYVLTCILTYIFTPMKLFYGLTGFRTFVFRHLDSSADMDFSTLIQLLVAVEYMYLPFCAYTPIIFKN